MDGHIAPFDAPVWKKWSPPAGHHRRCTRVALTEAQARRRGYPKADPGVEPDAGWAGDPTEGNEDLVRVVQARRESCAVGFAAKKRGRGLWCDEGPAQDRMRAMATALDHDAPMPAPRGLVLPLLPAGTSETEAFAAFMRAMGDEFAREIETTPFPDSPILSVSREIFTNHRTNRSKLDKRGRDAYVMYLAEGILRPDEAWLSEGSFGDRTLVLLARFVRQREVFGAVAAFKMGHGAWEGWSAFQTHSQNYLLALRTGVAVFRREV